MSKNPAAIGVILDAKQENVLLVRRHDIPVWVLPGGGIELEETPEEAVLREITEETGYKAKIRRKIGKYTPQNKLSELTHVFACFLVGGSPKLSQETKDIRFFSLEGLPYPMAPPHIQWIEDTLENQETIIERPIHGTSYFTLCKSFALHPLITLRFLLTKMGIHVNR